MLTMLTDWGIQWLGIKESNNNRRLVTGILGGFGCTSLYIKVLRKLITVVFGTKKELEDAGR